MRVYLNVIKFKFLEDIAYPTEVIAFLLRKTINLGFLLLFWNIVSLSSPELFDIKKIVSYFLISTAVVDLTFTTSNRLGRNILVLIKDGTLSNYLLKPVDTIKTLFFSYVGSKGTVAIYSLVALTIGIILYPPESIWGLIFFPISLFLTTLVGIGFNTYLGIIGFYTVESMSLRNSVGHLRRILSGSLVPLSYFPKTIRIIAELTPFPILAFYPTEILQSGDLNKATFMMLGISLLWGVVLLKSSRYFWNKSLKHYDGVGI